MRDLMIGVGKVGKFVQETPLAAPAKTAWAALQAPVDKLQAAFGLR
jgi:hypothetical protein